VIEIHHLGFQRKFELKAKGDWSHQQAMLECTSKKTEIVQQMPAQHTHHRHATLSSGKYMTKALDSKVPVEQQSPSDAQNWRAIVILLSDRSLSSGANNVSYHGAEFCLSIA
jgi:hypothetical protein